MSLPASPGGGNGRGGRLMLPRPPGGPQPPQVITYVTPNDYVMYSSLYLCDIRSRIRTVVADD